MRCLAIVTVISVSSGDGGVGDSGACNDGGGDCEDGGGGGTYGGHATSAPDSSW